MNNEKRGVYSGVYSRVFQATEQPQPVKVCPWCLAPIHGRSKYCNNDCYNAHIRHVALLARPATLYCEQCNKSIDPMLREPYYYKKYSHLFCDSVCMDAYRRRDGGAFYKEMSEAGIKAMKEYVEKEGKVPGYENRAAATQKGNKEAPTKKKVAREGKVWGYKVFFDPLFGSNNYVASIAELDIHVICSTKKEGLKLLREKFSEQRRINSK